jgi:hypothetical protein
MTKYADVHKTVVSEDFTLTFNAREVFNRMDDDYEIEDVTLVSVEMLGIDFDHSDLPPKMVDAFLDHFADDDNTEWEYF